MTYFLANQYIARGVITWNLFSIQDLEFYAKNVLWRSPTTCPVNVDPPNSMESDLHAGAEGKCERPRCCGFRDNGDVFIQPLFPRD